MALFWSRLGVGHASLRSRISVWANRCRHWLDGLESQAFGRAFKHSGRFRLYPDHVHAGTHLLKLERAVISCPCSLRTPSELSVVDPYAVQDDGEFSGDGNDGTSMPASLGQLHSPGFE